jgi:hypothetical protein
MEKYPMKKKPAPAGEKKGGEKTIHDKLNAAFSQMKKKNGPC